MARRAKVGYYPRCTRPSHNAGPAPHAAWELPKGETRGLAMWTEHGLRASRRYAVCIYGQHCRYLPLYLDWAAQSLKINALSLFNDLICTAYAKSSYPSAGNAPKPTAAVNSGERVPPPGRDLLDRRRQPGRTMSSSSRSPPTSNGNRRRVPQLASQPRGGHPDPSQLESYVTRQFSLSPSSPRKHPWRHPRN